MRSFHLVAICDLRRHGELITKSLGFLLNYRKIFDAHEISSRLLYKTCAMIVIFGLLSSEAVTVLSHWLFFYDLFVTFEAV